MEGPPGGDFRHPNADPGSTPARAGTVSRGAEGAKWISNLPASIAACERRWLLQVGPPFPRLSYNYAAPAQGPNGEALVLKLCFPDREFITEVEALRVYDGRGAVRLVEVDLQSGAMLLERLEPGTMLLEVESDDEALSIAAGVMRKLWRPAPAQHPFPTVEDWARGMERLRATFGGGTGPFPRRLVEQAEWLFAQLIPSMDTPVVLHGDLHHFNILSAGREPWLAIDPKGVVGEPAYETGALLRNPMPELLARTDLPRLSARRISLLAEELGISRERIHAWGLAQAVLSAWWIYEDHGEGWEEAMAVAQALSEIKP